MHIKLQNTTLYSLRDNDFDLSEAKIRGKKNSDTVIVALKDDKVLTVKEDELLEKLVRAIKRRPDETQVFAIENEEVTPFYKLSKDLSSQNFLFFGLKPKQLSLNIEVSLNQPVQINNRNVMFTDSLNNLVEDSSAKAQLWSALQSMFDLK